MRFVCESCRAQYMINDDKVGPKGVKVRCRKCGYVITVKRTDVTVPALPQVQDHEEAATQMMQAPPGNDPLDTQDTNPGQPPSVVIANLPTDVRHAQGGNGASNGKKPSDSFLGADEDEIGAVFDQVLKTGPTVLPKGKELNPFDDDDDRQSTRVIDAETVAALARESGEKSAAYEPVPEQNWFVAINEKQTGPMSLDKVKEHWDRGEVGPDSLCWREGYSDWLPLSEVKALAAVLAPKPPKPIVVPTAVIPPGPSVVSVPVQSAFSAGGMVQTVQSEVQVPIAAAAAPPTSVEDTGSWKPSAASALASLVKDEMDALAKPAAKAPPPPSVDDLPSSRGLLDLPQSPPMSSSHSPAPRGDQAPRAPTNPYLSNPGATFSAPAVTQYRPQSNRGLIIAAVAGVGVLLLALIGLVFWSINRQPQVVVAPPIAAPVPTPAPPTVAATNPPPTAPTAVPGATAATVATGAATAAASANPAPAGPNPTVGQPPPQPVTPKEARVASAKQPSGSGGRTTRDPAEPREVAKKEEPVKAAPSGGGDDFDKAFGGNAPKKEEPKVEPKKSPGTVFVPPAPGSAGDIKDSLGNADVLDVILANKPALTKCADEQRKREPGSSGKLVMKWQILTNGKVTGVTVVSEDFKKTYMAECVGGLLKGLVFPRHKQQGDPITFPFKF